MQYCRLTIDTCSCLFYSFELLSRHCPRWPALYFIDLNSPCPSRVPEDYSHLHHPDILCITDLVMSSLLTVLCVIIHNSRYSVNSIKHSCPRHVVLWLLATLSFSSSCSIDLRARHVVLWLLSVWCALTKCSLSASWRYTLINNAVVIQTLHY